MPAKPLTVDPFGTESLPMLYQTSRMPRHPFGLSQFQWLGNLGQKRGMILAPFDVVLEGGPTALLGLIIGEAGIVLWGDITQVPHHVHDFMIAEQCLHSAAIFRSLLLERHEQIHGLARLGTTIYQVANLYQGGFASGPMVLVIDQADVLKNGNKVVEGTVNVTDGNH